MNNENKTFKIIDLVEMLKNGSREKEILSIPEYQRDYVWTKDKVPALLDSIYRKYPIGSLTTWRNAKDGTIQLLDGLQRSFSLVNIHNSFDKYISANMIMYYIEKECLSEKRRSSWEEFFKEEKKSFKELSKTIAATVNRDGLEKTIINIKGLTTTGSTSKAKKYRMIWEALINIEEFHYKEFDNIEINRINIPSNFNQKDVTEIFKRLNTKGKPLNNFEVYTSIWSNYKFIFNDEFVNDFINQRRKKYAEALNANEDVIPVPFGSKLVNPSNYLYAVLIKIIKSTSYLKDTLLKYDEELEIYSIPEIETLTHIFLNYFKLKNTKDDFEILGEKMKEALNDNDQKSKELISIIGKSMKIVEENISLFKFSSKNENFKNIKNSLKISTHILISMINQVVNQLKEGNDVSLEKNQLDHWIIYESIENTYSKSSGKNGWFAVEENDGKGRYIKTIKESKETMKSFSRFIINFLEEEEDKELSSPSSTTKLLLVYLQEFIGNRNQSNLHIDHVIPYKFIKNELKIKKKIHTIYNLQILDGNSNIDKGNIFISNEYQYDFIADDYDTSKTIDKEKYYSMVENIKDKRDGSYLEFHSKRKDKINNIIENIFN